jgi:NAD-dependent deacetylase
VIEVHGSIDECVCPDCGGRISLERVLAILNEHPGAPECDACIAPLKPNVVLFGELLPEEALAEAYALASRADLLIAVGSSLEVYPVASLPRVTLDAGGGVALVTQGPTPYDGEAAVKLDGDVVDELGAVLAALDAR